MVPGESKEVGGGGGGREKGGWKPGAGRDGPRRIVSGLCCASPRYLFSLLNPPIVFSCGHSPIGRNWKGKTLIKGSGELHSIYLRWNSNILSCISFLSPFTWVIFLDNVQFSSVPQSYPTLCDPMNHRKEYVSLK